MLYRVYTFNQMNKFCISQGYI